MSLLVDDTARFTDLGKKLDIMRFATALLLIIGGVGCVIAAPLLDSGVEKRGVTSVGKGLFGSAIVKQREAPDGIASPATIGMREAPDMDIEIEDPLSIGLAAPPA